MGGAESDEVRTPVVPVILGVIGPRDVSEVEAGCIRETGGEMLARLDASCPHSEVIVRPLSLLGRTRWPLRWPGI